MHSSGPVTTPPTRAHSCLVRKLSSSDNRAGGVFMGIITFASIVVATAMTFLVRTLRNTVDMKSENDLTALGRAREYGYQIRRNGSPRN